MISTLDGRPRVLAFVKAWDPALQVAGELARIRSELRGLGSVMMVLSDAGAWSFRPDDEIERFEPGPATVEAMAERHAIDRACDAVIVLDGEGALRFKHTSTSIDGALESTLGDALAAAGAALVSRAQVLQRPGVVAASRLLFSRREWAIGSLAAGFAVALLGCKGKGTKEIPTPAPVPSAPAAPLPTQYAITLKINGVDKSLTVDARVSVLDALRERLGMPGTKKGCDHGQCGACTVHLDGRAVNSCLTLAVMAQGKAITTIEGLATGGVLHPVQQAFVEHDGFQCGYCTPGQIMSAVALLAEAKAWPASAHARGATPYDDHDIRERMSGNLCRCGAYPNIVAAVQAARKGA